MIATCKTDGKGFWSQQEKDVRLELLELLVRNGPFGSKNGELRVHFDINDWDVKEDGLIYTDELWIENFKKYLEQLHFTKEAIADVTYSEQGMQGEDYVSMDVGSMFIQDCDKFIRFSRGADPLPQGVLTIKGGRR